MKYLVTYMSAQKNMNEMDPESMIQMGLMMRFSGISSILVFLIVIFVNELDGIERILLLFAGLCSIPIGYFIGNRMIKEGKQRLKQQMKGSKDQ